MSILDMNNLLFQYSIGFYDFNYDKIPLRTTLDPCIGIFFFDVGIPSSKSWIRRWVALGIGPAAQECSSAVRHTSAVRALSVGSQYPTFCLLQ
jgi:hypothetical protein